jgi:formylglycine-generating enzyme required for sulfatase activity
MNKYDTPEIVAVDDSGSMRVLRGGAFFNPRRSAACVYRDNYAPNYDFKLNGVRVVMSVPISDLSIKGRT